MWSFYKSNQPLLVTNREWTFLKLSVTTELKFCVSTVTLEINCIIYTVYSMGGAESSIYMYMYMYVNY